MSLKIVDGKFVHHPKGARFEWDEEVAVAFPDMARRSLPLYREMHSLHAGIALAFALDAFKASGQSELYQCRVADIGASYGEFLTWIRKNRHAAGGARFSLSAFEPSAPMREALRQNVPGLDPFPYALGENEIGCRGGFDVVACHYTLQFVPKENQLRAVRELIDMVTPGGILLFSQKDGFNDYVPGYIKNTMQDEYLQWRRHNGYSDQEIADKTIALKDVMHVMPIEDLKHLLRPHFTIITDTVRMGPFGGFVAVKDTHA